MGSAMGQDRHLGNSPLRGDLGITQSMETLQDGYLYAVAAAARCSLAPPNRDRGIDWIVSHQSTEHSHDFEAELRVQLKSTYQTSPTTMGEELSISIENEQLKRLVKSPVIVSTILVVMMVPRNIENWIAVEREHLTVRHSAYWANLAGLAITGQNKTVVKIPTTQVFDDVALCEMMKRIGAGGKA